MTRCHGPPNYGETEPGSPPLAPFNPIEALEYAGTLLGRNAGPFVIHGDAVFSVCARGTEAHAAAVTRELDRVVDHVRERLSSQNRIGPYEHRLTSLRFHADPAVFGEHRQLTRDIGHHLRQVHRGRRRP